MGSFTSPQLNLLPIDFKNIIEDPRKGREVYQVYQVFYQGIVDGVCQL
jgi:hypothetical protein